MTMSDTEKQHIRNVALIYVR